jgi:hypothetical protein
MLKSDSLSDLDIDQIEQRLAQALRDAKARSKSMPEGQLTEEASSR